MRHTQPHKRRWFPERELIVRANGKCRFVKLTPRMQVAGVALLAAVAGTAIAAAVSLAGTQYETRAMQSALVEQEARVLEEESRVTAYRDELAAATLQLERRQAFLERMVEMLPAADGEVPAEDGEATASAGELHRISAALPEAKGLARIERRQLGAVAALTAYAEGRASRAEQAIRRLGLDPRRVVAGSEGTVQSGMGGPLESLATEADGSLDSRFTRLGASLARLAALELGLERVPQVMPTALGRMTSNFGYRRDPFTGEAALHSGLDFGGRLGDPIRAAAAGKVSFVGTRSGYGKVVEITHGNGLLTRYAHMSRYSANVGQVVEAGDTIGAIGSTGRSTGPHLHFEVRVNNSAVNPRPLLEDARDVLDGIRTEFVGRNATSGT